MMPPCRCADAVTERCAESGVLGMSFRVLTAGLVSLLSIPAVVLGAQGEEVAASSALREAGLTSYWQAALPLKRGDSVNAVYLLEENLYVATHLGDLYAVDPSVGLLRWARNVAARGRHVFKPSHLSTVEGRGAVLVTHAEGAYVYARDTGAVLAEIPELWTAGSGAVGDAHSFYVGSSDGHIYAVRWYDPIHRKAVRTWKVLGGGPVTSTPVLIDNILYFASQNGRVYACIADWEKDLQWPPFATEAAIEADLYVDESGVYVASLDRSLYRLDTTSGALLWRHRFPQPLRDPPIVSQRTVYQYCRGAGLYAIDVDTHELLWTQPSATAFVSRRAERTCVWLEDDRIAVLDSTSGKVRSVIPILARSLVAANPQSLAFYVVTQDGEMACFTADDVRHLRADDILKGLTPPGTTTSPEADTDAAEQVEDAADVDLDDPLRSGSDR